MRKTPSNSSSAACCRRHHFPDPCCLQPPKPSPAGSTMAAAVFAVGHHQAVERTARISDQARPHGDAATSSDPTVGAGLGLGMRQYLKCIVHTVRNSGLVGKSDQDDSPLNINGDLTGSSMQYLPSCNATSATSWWSSCSRRRRPRPPRHHPPP
jgi:hypothetical protein